MADPPKTPPHSDTEGVDRDGRPGLASRKPTPDPGRALKHAQDESKGRPLPSNSKP